MAVGASSLLLTLALTPAALAAGTVSASHGKMASGTYTGKTSQGEPIRFSVSGGEVSGAIEWKAHCTPKATLTSGTDFRAKVSHGTFAVSGSYTAPINGGQYEGEYHASIAGTIGRRRAHGTFKGSSKILSGSTKVASCKSGPLTWKAHK